MLFHRRRHLKVYPLRVKRKKEWDQGFIFLLLQTPAISDQMLAVMVLSQHQVSSSSASRPFAPFDSL